MTAPNDRYLRALQDVEGPIHELAIMAEVARVYIAEQPVIPDEAPDLIKELRRERDCSAALALRIDEMAKDLEEAFHAAFDKGEEKR
jgi:hypothetical protein